MTSSFALTWVAVSAAFAGPPLSVPDFDHNRSLSPLVQAVDPAVVTIEVASTVAPPQIPDALRPFFEQFGVPLSSTEPRIQQGEGSGFVISADGLLLTNFHVVDHADDIKVVFSDGREAGVTILGSDPDIDVALLRLEGKGPWPYVALGNSDALEVGDWVVAMGNGLGLGTTATIGIVSGKGRVLGHSVLGREEFLQTDAAINQGNSGGPLFSLDGKVVGMSTAIVQGANTVGFAIPSNLLSGLLGELERNGHVTRGYLGVSTQDLDEEIRAALGVTEASKGAVVSSVSLGTPAARSGIRSGDVIVEVDGQPIDDSTDLIDTISRHEPGETVTIRVARQDRMKDLTAVLAERPAGPPAPAALSRSPSTPSDGVTAIEGLVLAPLPQSVAARMQVDHGVLVVSIAPGSPAAGRLKHGDVILEVNRRPAVTVEDLEKQLARTAPGTAFLLVARGDTTELVALPME